MNLLQSSANIKYSTEITGCVCHNSSFKILYLNLQSIRNKFNDLEILLGSLNYEVHALVFTETWLKQDENQFFNIKGYSAFHSNRSTKRGGSVCIYIKNSISVTEIYEEEFLNCNILLVKLNDIDIKIGCIYRPPDTNAELFNIKLSEILEKFNKSIFFGDFNFNLLNKTDQDVIKYIDTITSNGYLILNNQDPIFHTRQSNSIKTTIDHIFSDILDLNYHLSIEDRKIGDHNAMQLCFFTNKIKIINQSSKTTISVTDYGQLTNVLNNTNFDQFNSFNDLSSYLTSKISLFTTQTERKKINNNKRKPWITDELLSLVQTRDHYRKLMGKYPSNPFLTEQFNLYAAKVKKMNIKEKKKHFQDKFEEVLSDPRKYWHLIKQVIFNKDSLDTIYQLKSGDKLLRNELEIANSFNKFFTTICNNNSPVIPISLHSNQETENAFEFQFTSSDEVQTLILNLKSKCSTGLDKISAKMLKRYSEILSSTVAKLINLGLSESRFPDCFKLSKVTPVFKSGDKHSTKNYRPISVLNSISKIFEHIINTQLSEFLDSNNLISPNQFGFRKKSSTTSACINLTNFLTKNLDDGKYVACMFLDLRRAFDSLDHALLVKKLTSFKLSNKSIELIQSYLYNREQVVKIGQVYSDKLSCCTGIPQGSILGPLLFNVFINDVFSCDFKGVPQLYADDACIMYSVSSCDMLEASMKHDLVVLDEWLKSNNLCLNVSKSKYLIFEKRSKEVAQFILSFNGETIERVNHFSYLGLLIDSKLKWHAHIDKIKKTIIPFIFTLRRVSKILPTKALVNIYHSYINAHLIYLNPIWGGASDYKLKELFILQKKAIKYIYKLPKLYPSANLFDKLLSFTILTSVELLVLIFKIINGFMKIDIDLKKVHELHTYQTRRVSHYQIQKFKTEMQKHNVIARGLTAYNNLPSNIKQQKTIVAFKTEVLKYLNKS